MADFRQSKDLWKDLKLTNTDLSNLLSELDKAIEHERNKGGNSENLEEKTNQSQVSGQINPETSQASPSGSLNN